jgi:hypothetical protein
MEKKIGAFSFFMGKREEKRPLAQQDVYGRIIFK